MIYQELGNITSLTKDYTGAIPHFQQCLDLLASLHDSKQLKARLMQVRTFISLGYCLRMEGDMAGALANGK